MRYLLVGVAIFSALITASMVVRITPDAVTHDAAAEVSRSDATIVTLRGESRYGAAFELATTQRERMAGSVHALKLQDHDRLVDTLARAARLDPDARDRLARADAQVPELDRLTQRGDLIAALRLATEQLRTRFDLLGPEHTETLDAWDRMARTARSAGDYDTTLEITRHVLSERRRVLGAAHPRVALSLSRMGQVLRNLGALDEAEPLYREALEIAEPLRREYPDVYLEILYGWSFWQGWTDPATSVEMLKRALRLAEELGERTPIHTSTITTWLGWMLANSGRHEEAWPWLQRADRMLREAKLDQSFNLAVVTAAMADLHAVSGQWDEAGPRYREAMKIFELQRSMTPPGFSRRRVHYGASANLALTLLKQARWEEAWRAATHSSGILTREFIANARWKRVAPESFAERQSVRRRIEQIERSTDDAGDSTAMERLLRSLELRTRIVELEQAYLERHLPPELEPAQVQAMLAPDTAYIGWLNVKIGNVNSVSRGLILASDWCYVVRRDSIDWIPLTETSDPEAHRAHEQSRARYSITLTRAGEWPLRVGQDDRLDAWQSEWGKRYFEPAMEYLDGVENLIVEVGGVAPRVAVETMRGSDGLHIGDRFTVSYSSSTAMLSMLPERARRGRRQALVIGDPLFAAEQSVALVTPDMISPSSSIDSTQLHRAIEGDREALSRLPRLPLSRFEAERIAELFPVASLLTGESASEQRLREMARSESLSGFDVIHLATHTLFDRIPERCALALARTRLHEHPGNDGLLNTREILQTWSLDADVLTLSGCQSATLAPGAQTFPLAQALLGVGARSVVASMWKVDDLSTALLMTRFYENLTGVREAPMSKARALQQAKIWLREHERDDGSRPFAHPAYWSGFILIGSPN